MSGPVVRVRRIGREEEPVAIIDDFAADPEALLRFAATQDFTAAGRHYPGIKAPLPTDYLRAQAPAIGAVMREVFGATGKVTVLEARFSIVTATPADLSLEQRLPHVDAVEAGHLALIHYLVPTGTDGTAFYRHRTTGYETVDEPRSAAYFGALNRDIARHGTLNAYIADDTPLFEQTASIPGTYNRALIYRGRLLHSGAIAAGAALPPDPMTGRLTVTGFFIT